MKALIQVASPIHIGDGNTYNPMEYMIWNGRFHYVPHERLVQVWDKAMRERWIAYLESEEMPTLRDFAAQNRLEKRICEASLYSLPYRLPKERMRDVRSFVKTCCNVYLPGSELKGALRTAILYGLLSQNRREYENLVQSVLDADDAIQRLSPHQKREKSREIERVEQEMSVSLLCPERTPHRLRHNYDLLRFVQIADSNPRSIEDAGLFLGKVNIHHASRPITAYAEFIAQGSEFTCDRFLQDWTKDKNIGQLGYAEDQLQTLTPESILTACHLFSKDLLAVQKEYFRSDNTMRDQLAELEKWNAKDIPLLPIGAYGGFFHTSIVMCIRQNDPDIIRDILRFWTKGRHYENFPKTSKDVEDGRMAQPIGWIRIEVKA